MRAENGLVRVFWRDVLEQQPLGGRTRRAQRDQRPDHDGDDAQLRVHRLSPVALSGVSLERCERDKLRLTVEGFARSLTGRLPPRRHLSRPQWCAPPLRLGTESLLTCMGLFLSSSFFGYYQFLVRSEETRSSSRRLRSGFASARKGSSDRNASRAWRLAALSVACVWQRLDA